ncbi:MAG: chorismate-binding protein [Oscillospiraceae bacterium]|jgi:anthranilate synthase component 1|nr:chorismate-binding protein [Oscillospiraceae bacterium]
MTYKPDLREARALSAGYKTVPVSCEIYSDGTTPIEVMRRLKNVSKQCFILESAEDRTRWGRYTFLGYDPKLTVDSDVELLKKTIADNVSPKIEGLPPFTGGLVGYFSYEFITLAEPDLKLDANDAENFKIFDLMLFDKVIAFDNLKQKIILVANAETDNLEENYQSAVTALEEMRGVIANGEAAVIPPLKILSPFRELFSKEQYCEMVKRAKRRIYDGDIFQVVLSNRLDADAKGSLFDAYRVLRTVNPSPYMFYFGSDDIEIAGASPETLVKLTGGKLYTYPLAGTRPRGVTDEEDALLEKELLSDAKELAEHNMLVDLGRNDLGKISRFGTVEVENYLHIVRFSHVMHIASAVKGEIRTDKTALDAVSAVIPAGTLSGAPKLRACEIIAELEDNRRGIYGGALGYIAFNGDMDVCISIRLCFKKDGKVFARSGAGIVADSVPEREYEECANKAKAVINALLESEGGI